MEATYALHLTLKELSAINHAMWLTSNESVEETGHDGAWRKVEELGVTVEERNSNEVQ